MSKTINARLTIASKTSSEWETLDPVLLAGEPCWVSDVGMLKIGDGTSSWSELPYLSISSSVTEDGSAAATSASVVSALEEAGAPMIIDVT